MATAQAAEEITLNANKIMGTRLVGIGLAK
jgi:hypothetical protein